MKIFNKFVESKKEPSNKNDIWFDGSTVRLYKEGEWYTVTLSKEAIERLLQYAENVDIFKYVNELPEVGDPTFIYFKKEESNGNLIVLPYVYDGEWKQITNTEVFSEASPFGFGEAENSAVLKGGNNQVISEGGVAVGSNNIVGLKGWYYKALNINTTSKTIDVYLTKKQTIPVLGKPTNVETDVACNLFVDNIISIVNDSKYDNKFRVVNTSFLSTSGFISIQAIDDLPFTTIKQELILDPEDYSIYCLSKPDVGIADIGQGSFAVGYDNKSTNGKATAVGFNNHAYGKFSFAEGRDNEAGYAAHAEGRGTKADGEESHAEGLNTTASGKHSHAEGDITEAMGVNAHAEGYLSKASGNSSHAEGGNWVKGATGAARINGGTAEGAGSHAEGGKTTAIADYSHAEGYRSIAGGPNSHTEGQLTRTGGEDADRPTGNPGTKSGQNAHAEGAVTFAQGAGSHAEGGNTWASGNYSHTEGWQTRTHPNANNSHAEGFYTEVYNRAEHASGQYNKSTNSSDASRATHFSIGIGTSDTDRKNAFEVKQNGDIYIEGVEGRIQDRLNINIDSALSDTSINPVQNKAIVAALATKTSEDDVNELIALEHVYFQYRADENKLYFRGFDGFDNWQLVLPYILYVTFDKPLTPHLSIITDDRTYAISTNAFEIDVSSGEPKMTWSYNGKKFSLVFDESGSGEQIITSQDIDYATTEQLTELSAEVGKKVGADFVNNAIAEAIGEAIDGGY